MAPRDSLLLVDPRRNESLHCQRLVCGRLDIIFVACGASDGEKKLTELLLINAAKCVLLLTILCALHTSMCHCNIIYEPGEDESMAMATVRRSGQQRAFVVGGG